MFSLYPILENPLVYALAKALLAPGADFLLGKVIAGQMAAVRPYPFSYTLPGLEMLICQSGGGVQSHLSGGV